MKIRDLILILYLIVLSSSISLVDVKKEIKNVEDLISLSNTKEFQNFVAENEEVDDLKLQLSLFGGDECLVSKSDAKDILKMLSISNTVDDNMRFILGKCSPVLLIPGIYATKMMVEVQCKNIAQYERTTTLKEIRIFCGDTICAKESTEKEEHPLFVGLFDKAFSILGSETDKYSS